MTCGRDDKKAVYLGCLSVVRRRAYRQYQFCELLSRLVPTVTSGVSFSILVPACRPPEDPPHTLNSNPASYADVAS